MTMVDWRAFSQHRHCERSEAILNLSAETAWIALLRSQWRSVEGWRFINP
jgi:hypothetical protein